MIDTIIETYNAADDEARTAGLSWYAEAQELAQEVAILSGKPLANAAVAIAHLSPRVQWITNKRASLALARGEDKPSGIMARSWLQARNALAVDDPWSTFSKRARKTHAFARAILGDEDAVTVDVWAARAAGEDPEHIRTQYEILANEYRQAASQIGVSPRELQAITWVQARGRAA